MSATLGVIASIQPIGYDGEGGPYLHGSLGGTVPGLAFGVQRWRPGRPLFALEISSTTALEVVQSGRFVPGGGPSPARQRDTLVSLLSGARIGAGGGGMEIKGGLSVAFGQPRHGDPPLTRDTGHLALTAGIDGAAPLGRRWELVPTARYSYVRRGGDALFVGLGDHVVRVGLGLRIRPARSERPATRHAVRPH